MTVTELEKQNTSKMEARAPARERRLGGFWSFTLVYAALIAALNVSALCSQSVSDFYADHIFRFAAETTGRFSGLFPFSLGEVLITLALILLCAAVIVLILMIFLRKKKRFIKAACTYLKAVLVTALTVVLLYTLNCTFLYCSTPLSFSGGIREFQLSDFEEVRNGIVERCNELAPQMERKDDGTMVFPGNAADAAADALHRIADEFPRLSGYYPHAKPMWGSYFMYRSGVIGVYFPFSMEANYSKYVSDSYMPHVVAHEYAHLKGYIYESEANFMSYLACTRSDDPAVRYSGYLCVLSYIDSDYKNSVPKDRYDSQVQISDTVRFDNSCYDRETWEYLKKRDEQTQPKAAEIVENVSDKMTDAYMDALDYKPNYSEVTLLMMQYYSEFGGFDGK